MLNQLLLQNRQYKDNDSDKIRRKPKWKTQKGNHFTPPILEISIFWIYKNF